MHVPLKGGQSVAPQSLSVTKHSRAQHTPVNAPAYSDREQLLQHIRQSKGADTQRLWRPQLEPPAALAALSLVLVGPKKPPNVGSAARLCNCFECDDLRVVDSGCNIRARSSLNAAMGGQRLLWQAANYGALPDAIADCAYSIAFGRWAEGSMGSEQRLFRSASAMAAYLEQKGLLTGSCPSDDTAQQRVAFVFGREVEGLKPEEVAACSAVCQLPMGRLQESLSLTHAVAIAMSVAFETATGQNC